MKLYLVRHGETDWNRDRISQGITDTLLNETGRAQSVRLAEHLGRLSIGAIYSSPLKRAAQTAGPIASKSKVEIKYDPDLKEMNQGAIEGKKLDQMVTEFPEVIAKWLEDPGSVRLPGGETLGEAQERGWSAVKRISESHSDENVIAVSHNLVILGIICRAISLDLKHLRKLKQDSTAVNVLEFNNGHCRVLCINDTCHLNGA